MSVFESSGDFSVTSIFRSDINKPAMPTIADLNSTKGLFPNGFDIDPWLHKYLGPIQSQQAENGPGPAPEAPAPTGNKGNKYIDAKTAYHTMLTEVQKEYKVIFREKDWMLHNRKSIGFEYGNVIEIAKGLSYEEATDVLIHEYSAKKTLGTNRWDGDHAAAHPEIIGLSRKIKKYLPMALDANSKKYVN